MSNEKPPPLPVEYTHHEASRKRMILKDRIIQILVAVIAISLLAWLLIPSSPVTVAEGLLRTALPKGTTLADEDDTGPGLPIPGGASDGYTWLILKIQPDHVVEFAKKISESPLWKPLPLPPNLSAGVKYLQPTIAGCKGYIPLENIKGYYILIDQQVEWNQRWPRPKPLYETSKPIWERHSLDYTFGVFDEACGLLYVWSINT